FGRVTNYPALMGMQEKRETDLSAFTKWSGMFARFDRELNDLKNKNIVQSWQRELMTYRGLSMKKTADAVNRLVNQKRYILDNNNWGKSDYWATPVEFLKRGGDCEDFAIAKYTALRSLGFPEERLRLAIVQDLQKNIPHAVLVVYTDEGAYLLDNQNKNLVSAEYGSRYKPIYSINRHAWWLHSKGGKTLLASAE
ncbi:MAG: transglutaminase-like cysteine peptidase, partial [Bdellovibrionales bacterium]